MAELGFQELERYFRAATAASPDEREALISSLRERSPESAARLLRMLETDEATSFLDAPLVERPGSFVPAPESGESVAGYELVEPIASGGMGTVFKARQQRPQRLVALKLLREGMVSDDQLRRFEREAEILGTLDHPGIARIFEAGICRRGERELPFVAMELIDGENLRARLREGPQDLRPALDLVARICDAIEHTHQKGIVHRDLKPENVLIDREGRPRVVDFGVAGLDRQGRDQDRMTQTGQIFGTLAYMSPEQTLGDPRRVDTRTDLYALGALLYEMLAGRPPHELDGLPLHERLRRIQEVIPERLGKLRPELRGDVEIVVAKALEHDPERRYATASAMASDLRAILAHAPIQARPATLLYHWGRFARRNRLAIAGVVVLLALFAAWIDQTLRSKRDLAAAKDRIETVSREQQEALDFLTRSIQSIGVAEYGTRASLDSFLGELEYGVRSSFAPGETKRRGLLEAVCEAYIGLRRFDDAERLVAELESAASVPVDPELRRALALRRRGHLLRRKGSYVAALEALDEAASLLLRRPEERKRALITCDYERLQVLGILGRQDDALKLLETVLPRAREVLPADDLQLLALESLAITRLRVAGRYEEALKRSRAVISPLEQGASPRHRGWLAATLESMAVLHLRRREHDEARALLTRAWDTAVAALGERQAHHVVNRRLLGHLLVVEGKIDEADRFLRELLEKQRALGIGDHVEAETLETHAAVLLDARRGTEARERFEECLAIRRRLHPEGSRHTASLLAGLGTAYRLEKRGEESIPILREAIQEARRFHHHEAESRSQLNLAVAHLRAGRKDQAFAARSRELDLLRRHRGEKDLQTLLCRVGLGIWYFKEGRRKDALPHLEAVALLAERKEPKRIVQVAVARVAWAECLLREGKSKRRAREQLEAAIRELESRLPASSPPLRQARKLLGTLPAER